MNPRIILLIVAVGIGGVVAIWFLSSLFTVVGVGQVGIVTQFGHVQGELQSGFHMKSPIQGVTLMSIQTQKDNVQAGAATHDLQQLDANVNFNFHLTPDTAYTVFRKVGAGYDGTIIQPYIQEAVKANTALFNADEEIDKRPIVEAAIFKDLQTKLAPWGITADSFSILDFGFSQQFNDAVEKKTVASQQTLQAQYDLQTAQLKAQSNQVQQAALTDAILTQQAISKWDGHMPQVVSGGTGNIFGVNLQK